MRVERVIPILIVLASVVVGVCLLLALPKSQEGIAIAITVVSCVVLVLGTSAYFDRKRRREIGETLERMGLTVGEPTEARMVHNLLRGQRSLTGKFWASGMDPAGLLDVAEFTYLTGSGKHTQTHRNMQVSRPTPPPGRWPEFRVSRRLGFLRRPITKLIGAQDFGLENEEFGKRWTIECEDKDFVVLVLSPIVQDWLMLAPKYESWTISEGRVCLTRERRCYAPDVEAMIARLDEFLGMLPGELAAYDAGQKP